MDIYAVWNLRSPSSESPTGGPFSACWPVRNARWVTSSGSSGCRSRRSPSTSDCCARRDWWRHGWMLSGVSTGFDTSGPVKLSTVGAPSPQVSETTVKRAEAPKLLEYNWGGNDIRWQLEPLGDGTRLTLWHNIDRRFISWGAAGWHICFDVLDRFLGGEPIGRMVGPDVLKNEGWQRLNAAYAKQFDVEAPGWGQG